MIPLITCATNRDKACEFESLLASFMTEFASELRAYDLEELLSCVRSGAHTALADFISTASERFFRVGNISYGWHAEAEIDWFGRNYVTVALELNCPEMTVFFCLRLESGQAAVLINHIFLWSQNDDFPSPNLFESWISACRIDAGKQGRN